MGIVHIALFKFKEGLAVETQEAIKQELLSFKEKISVIQYISCGQNFSTLAKGFDFALVARFNSREDLDTYMGHPIHLASQKVFQEHIVDVALIDYEG